jgi:hypothetical protein
LNKIINAKRIPAKDPLKDLDIMYGSTGMAVIHPPVNFNLPDMIIVVRHIDKQSSLGAEDMLAVNLWLETPRGYAYVPVATIGDNPEGVKGVGPKTALQLIKQHGSIENAVPHLKDASFLLSLSVFVTFSCIRKLGMIIR